MSRAWLVALCALAISCAGPPPVSEQDDELLREKLVEHLELDAWREYVQPEFHILTNAEPREAKRAARRLGRFVDAAKQISNTARFEPALPMRIFLFRTRGQFHSFPVSNAAAYAMTGPRWTALVAQLETRGSAMPILYHEYTHYLWSNAVPFHYPLWYSEGSAEMFSTLVVRDDVAIVGAVPEARRWSLSQPERTPLELLLDATHYGQLDGPVEIDRFYADAWLLVHHLHASRGSDLPAQLTRYVEAIAEGVAPSRAWQAAFGSTLEELESALARHRPRVLAPIAPVMDVVVPHVARSLEGRSVPAQRMALMLGELALAIEQKRSAGLLFREAGRLDPEDPLPGLGLAAVATLEQRWQTAEGLAQAATRALPGESLASERLGDVHRARLELLLESEDPDPQEAERLRQRARAAYARATELDAGVWLTWYRLGSTYLDSAADPGPGVRALERALALSPHEPGPRLDLARLHLRLGQTDEARQLLKVVLQLAHAESQRSDAEELLSQIDGTPANP